jgi:hypothetical protein
MRRVKGLVFSRSPVHSKNGAGSRRPSESGRESLTKRELRSIERSLTPSTATTDGDRSRDGVTGSGRRPGEFKETVAPVVSHRAGVYQIGDV